MHSVEFWERTATALCVERRTDKRRARWCAVLVVARSVRGYLHRCARLLAPPIGEQSGVDGSVANRIDEPGHSRFGRRAVACDGQRGTVGRAGWARKVEEVFEPDVVEHFHDLRLWEEAEQV